MTFILMPYADPWKSAEALKVKLLVYQVDLMLDDLENAHHHRPRNADLEAQWGYNLAAEITYAMYMSGFVGTKQSNSLLAYRWTEAQNIRNRHWAKAKNLLREDQPGKKVRGMMWPSWVGRERVHESHRLFLAFKNQHYADVFGIKRPREEPELLWT